MTTSASAKHAPGQADRSASGPAVFLHYDQAALDAAYDQAHWAPNRTAAWERRTDMAELVRDTLGAPERHAYGPTDIEQLDVFRAPRAGAPILIFLHGGAWTRGTAREHGFPAEMFVSAGVTYVVPDFADVTAVQGDLGVLVDQCRRAIAWVYRNAERIGGDRDRIYLCGQSSGGHLASVALITDWAAHGVPGDVVKAALCISGLYDLRGARLSARSRYVAFTDAIEDGCSAQRHIAAIPCPVTVAYGTLDSPEFQRMGAEFADALAAAGKLATRIVARGYNHFELLETLGNPYGILGRSALAMMGLAPGR